MAPAGRSRPSFRHPIPTGELAKGRTRKNTIILNCLLLSETSILLTMRSARAFDTCTYPRIPHSDAGALHPACPESAYIAGMHDTRAVA
eukprot:5410019-Pyramimonas_sp.AAC.1